MRTNVLMALMGAATIAAGTAPAAADTLVTYQCSDGTQFVFALYDGDRTAHLQLDGRAVALSQRVSVNGTRYSKGDVTLRITETATTLTRGKKSTQCLK